MIINHHISSFFNSWFCFSISSKDNCVNSAISEIADSTQLSLEEIGKITQELKNMTENTKLM